MSYDVIIKITKRRIIIYTINYDETFFFVLPFSVKKNTGDIYNIIIITRQNPTKCVELNLVNEKYLDPQHLGKKKKKNYTL